MLKSKIENYLAKALKEVVPRGSASVLRKSAFVEIFAPENERFGHYSTNVALKLAKIKKKNPLAVAKEIVKKLSFISHFSLLISRVEIVSPGFINFWLSEQALDSELKAVLKTKEKYGSSQSGKGKTTVIDYSGPNVAKPMNVGHLRSTLIGRSLADIFRFQGYKVIADNHLGDWGTQFGALIVAYKKWGDKREFNKNPIAHLVKLYIRFHREPEKHNRLLALAREETKKLQDGDRENRTLWRLFVKESLKEFNKIYKRLDVKFDLVLGESFYQPLLKDVVEEALKKKVAKKEDGAIKILFDKRLPSLVIQKSDGSHLYSTTDLATIKYRVKKWRPKEILYVVANEQTLHFEQIFEAGRRLKYAKDGVLKHVKFGMVLGETGKKMSTRKGEFIKLGELLDEARKKAARINRRVAEIVGIGAVKYRVLSQERKSDIVFDWGQMLNLKGNSSPYLQYTYSRLKSVLRKAGGLPEKPDFLLLESESEKSVMRQLMYFPDAVSRAAESCETNIVADYLYKLADILNRFYESEPILKAPRPLRENRLNLILAATIVLKNGLNLLGIKSPERM
jgi:arginyl-tRNA synthetase